jgi:mono/diheme cytochrome c family protein
MVGLVTPRKLVLGLAALVVLAVFVVRSRTGAEAPSPSPAEVTVAEGRQLFARNCAACHGERGQGDGPSAGGFATKPANLADGRLMNALPDEFLFDIVKHGGSAVGLAPTMPPFRGNLADGQIRAVIAYVRTLAEPPFRSGAAGPLVTPPIAPAQPIRFNHVVHAGSFQIPCQYCHADARRSPYAGLPSVDRCMGCHKVIGAQDNPEIAKIHGYWQRREPIPWVQVFKLPEYTYFSHKPHISAGVACQTCHGPVERMPVVGRQAGPNLVNDLQNVIGVRPPAPQLSMGWCITCHREQNAARGTQAPLDCVTCHH